MMVQNHDKPVPTFISSKDQRMRPAGVYEMRSREARSPNCSAGGTRELDALATLIVASTTSGDSSSTGGTRSTPSGRDFESSDDTGSDNMASLCVGILEDPDIAETAVCVGSVSKIASGDDCANVGGGAPEPGKGAEGRDLEKGQSENDLDRVVAALR